MKLDDYPRPPGDTGIGFHWFPTLGNYSQTDLDTFMPRLKALGVNWLALLSDPVGPISETFIRRLIEEAIEPVIRIYTPTVHALDQNQLRALAQTYADWGVHYIHPYNEPNLVEEWGDAWNPEALPDRFMDYALPCLETLYAVDGIIPVLPPLAPGGNYWDLDFFRIMLDLIVVRGKEYLFDKLAIGIHNYADNRPLDWGRGGRAAWPCAQSGYLPPGCQDHRGFRLFEWYDELVRARVGRSLPMICGENGVIVGRQGEAAYPPIDEALHAQRSVEMSRMVMEGEVPNYVFNNAFWLLAAGDDNMFAAHRWFRPDGRPVLSQSVNALMALPKRPRQLKPALTVPETIRVLMPDDTVVVMNLEEYLKGVIPAEIGTGQPMEALKAQAVAARCYAVTARRHPDKGADVCTTSHCQVWKPDHYPDTDQAVNDTAGVLVVYQPAPAPATAAAEPSEEVIRGFYFGHCDGHTRNSEDVWVTALPYCRSVPCPRPYDDLWGHGVGMCQEGAIAMAEQGGSFEDILTHYYTGVRVVDTTITPPQPAADSVIRGIVTDEAGTVQAGLRLILRSETWSTEAITDDGGAYRFAGLPAGVFSLEVADRDVRRDGLHTDGTNELVVDLVVPAPGGWTMSIERQPGLRLLVGTFPRPGIPVTVSDPWGNHVSFVSGSKPEYGAGGFEVPLWADTDFTIRFLDQTFRVQSRGDYIFATFRESGSGTQTGTIRGTVTDESGAAKAGLRLVLRSGEWSAETSTGADGWYEFAGLAFGRYELEVRGTSVRQTDLEVNSTSPLIVDLVVPTTTGWTMNVSRQAGLRLLTGSLPRPGIHLTISDPWGNNISLLSGSKPEHGPGGFEAPLWHDGLYTIRFLDQVFEVEVGDERVHVVFEEGAVGPAPADTRLVTEWMTLGLAEQWLAHFEAQDDYRGLFTIARLTPPPPAAGEGWTATELRQPGLRLIIGRMPRANIAVTVTDPWGNQIASLLSGSKPEHGPGGFEVPVWHDGLYTIRFLDQVFRVEVRDGTVQVTFTEGGPAQVADARLETVWITAALAGEWLQHFEGLADYRGLFRVETAA